MQRIFSNRHLVMAVFSAQPVNTHKAVVNGRSEETSDMVFQTYQYASFPPDDTSSRPTEPEQTRGTRPGQDPKRVATSLVADTFREFLSNEADVWLVKRETLESKVRNAARDQ